MVATKKPIMDWLSTQDDDKIFEIKEKKAKRSLSQNSYAWVLITHIADILRTSKEEVYKEMLMSYGQSTQMSMLSSIDPVGWYKYYELIDVNTLNNEEYVTYRVYKGSSEYDSKEMSIFIDGIISECKELGIPTLTPEQIREMRII